METRCCRNGAGLWLAVGLVGIVAATRCAMVPEVIPPDDPSVAELNVSGTYQYTGSPLFNLSGTVTFEQEGEVVRLTRTTYDAGTNRPVIGEAALVGNVLNISLVPENGDTDYRADVEFIFGEDGDTFSVAFSDTNNDVGPQGSFSGTRVNE